MIEAEKVVHTCGARNCNRICNTVAIWRRWSEAGIDGYRRITKIQGMSRQFPRRETASAAGGSALCLLPVTKLLPKVCLGISADRDFAR